MKFNKMTQEQKDVVIKMVEKESGMIFGTSMIFGFVGGIFGLGLGLIFLGFLQAIGFSIVSGVVSMALAMTYTIYGPIMDKAIRAIEKGQSE
jgi:uncharacterized protein YacL